MQDVFNMHEQEVIKKYLHYQATLSSSQVVNTVEQKKKDHEHEHKKNEQEEEMKEEKKKPDIQIQMVKKKKYNTLQEAMKQLDQQNLMMKEQNANGISMLDESKKIMYQKKKELEEEK